MDDLDLSNAPNPFSVFANDRQRSRKKLASAASFLTLVVALMLAVGFGQGYFQRLHIANLLDGFANESAPQKVERLQQLKQYDAAALSGLAGALTDAQPEVSEFAFSTLSAARRSWSTQPDQIASKRRSELAALLEKASASLPPQSASINDQRRDRLNQLAQSIAHDELASRVPDQGTVRSAMNVIAFAGGTAGTVGTVGTDLAIATLSSDVQNNQLWNRDLPMTESSPRAALSAKPLPAEPLPAKPLPIGSMADHWSDWPPAPESLPRLYKQSYAALGQVQPDESEKAEPQLLRPTAHLATESVPPEVTISIVEDYEQLTSQPVKPVSYWTRQLASPNFRVRLRAVQELRNLHQAFPNQSISRTLAQHLEIERDEKVIARIRAILGS